MQWKYFEDAIQSVEKLKKDGYVIYAAEQAKGSTNLYDMRIPAGQKTALVFGNEVKGVQQKIIDQCEACIEIPQFGTKHSLNVSVSAGIIIWEIFKQLHHGLER